jgi:transcriptional regulator with XRE-family HTH domain
MGKHVSNSVVVHNVHMPARIGSKPQREDRSRKKTFLRAWREHRDLSLEAVCERLGLVHDIELSHASLSRIERGKQDYNQSLLEALAVEYRAGDAASLLMRDPSDPDAVWSIWEQAKQGQKKTIVEVMKSIVKTGT